MNAQLARPKRSHPDPHGHERAKRPPTIHTATASTAFPTGAGTPSSTTTTATKRVVVCGIGPSTDAEGSNGGNGTAAMGRAPYTAIKASVRANGGGTGTGGGHAAAPPVPARARRYSVYQRRAPPGLPPRKFDDSFRVLRKTERALERLGFQHEDDKRMQRRVLLRNLWVRLNARGSRVGFVRDTTNYI